jgi:hypothetical protein
MATRLVSGRLDCLHDHVERGLVGRQHRRKAPFVTNRRREVHLAQHFLQGMKDLDSHPKAFGEAVSPDRHDHEFLRVHVVRGVRSAVQDVHHGHGQHPGHRPAKIAVERQAAVLRRRPCHRHRNTQDSIGAELAFVRRTVGIHHLRVDLDLVGRGAAFQPGAEDLVHVANRFGHALSAVPLRVPIPELHRLVFPSGGAAWHSSAPLCPTGQNDFGFYGRISPAIQDLSGVNFDNRRHEKMGQGI